MGDPSHPVEDEPMPNSNRVNMGTYGGTKYASRSPGYEISKADFNIDGRVDHFDLIEFLSQWLNTGKYWTANFNNDEIVDIWDWSLFAVDWLWIADWYLP